jgi:predicted pyridoxine 5'-phosphate oxidase superfamily flavin-nucleotide-binding protein
VRVADDKTLMLPDRRGNNRIDSQPTTANGRACSEDDVVIAGSAPFHHLTLRRPRSGRLEG